MASTIIPDQRVYTAARMVRQGYSKEEVREVLLECLPRTTANSILRKAEGIWGDQSAEPAFLQLVNDALGEEVYEL